VLLAKTNRACAVALTECWLFVAAQMPC